MIRQSFGCQRVRKLAAMNGQAALAIVEPEGKIVALAVPTALFGEQNGGG